MASKPNVSLDYKIRKTMGKSAITNGTFVLPGLDGRSALARRFRDITDQVIVDQGGAELCSEARTQLIRRFSACCVMAEQMEAELATGKNIRIDLHTQLTNALVKVAARIGIDRRSRNITPRLQDYLADQTADENNEEEVIE
jgi:hypothetical protein